MKILVLGVSICVNLILVMFLLARPSQKLEVSISPTPAQLQYPYISKRVFASQQHDLLVNFVELRKKLRAELAATSGASLYFEYLPTGTSIGIGEDVEYVQASLLKVPLAMAVLKKVEAGQLRTTNQLTIQDSDIDPNFGQLYKRGIGAKLTIADVLAEVLSKSDNTARNMLFRVVTTEEIVDVYDYLGIPKDFGQEPTISAKNYSSILRSLYFSSYLNSQNSNAVLDLLTRSEFSDKLAAGVPGSVPVAHKIGVRDGRDGEADVFTDCGIIYGPKRPYLLCLMAEMPEDKAQMIMKSVSGDVYEYVSQLDSPK